MTKHEELSKKEKFEFWVIVGIFFALSSGVIWAVMQ